AGIITVYVSNPLTLVPIYWFNYRVGTLFCKETVTWEEFKRLFVYNNFAEWIQSLKALVITVGLPLWVGSFVVGIILSVLSYVVIRPLAEKVQRRRREHNRSSSPAEQDADARLTA